MLVPRSSGYHTLLAQSGATMMNWARSVLIFFRTWEGEVSAERRIGVPNSSLTRMRLRARAALEIPACRSADIARSRRWRIDLAKVLPIAERDLVPPPDADAIRGPLGISS